MSDRKSHVRVDQARYLHVLEEVGGCARLDDLAAFLDVSEATARRKLDGLVYRGSLVLMRERPREYALPGAA